MDFEKVLTNLTELAATWGLRVIGVIVVLVVAWILFRTRTASLSMEPGLLFGRLVSAGLVRT